MAGGREARAAAGLLLAAALGGPAVPVRAGQLMRVASPAPAGATVGEPVSIAVVVEGAPGAAPTAVVYFRAQGSSTYRGEKLVRRGRGRYEGAIPASATRGLAVYYYIEVTSPDGSHQTALGTSGAPLTLQLRDPPPEPGTAAGLYIGLAAALLLGAGGALQALRSLRRRRILDRVFWLRTLFPYLHLEGRPLQEQLQRLAATELPHPRHGPRKYPPEHILLKLEEVRRLDLESLHAQARRHLGREAALASLPEPAPAGHRGPEAPRFTSASSRA